MILVAKRPPHDSFTFRLFYNLIRHVKVPYNAIYVWSAALLPFYQNNSCSWNNSDLYPACALSYRNLSVESELVYRSQIVDTITEDIIVFAVKDHLTYKQFNPWKEDLPDLLSNLTDFFRLYSNKKIILVTSLENLESYINLPNVSIVSWGGDITNQQQEYKKLNPVLDKNFTSKLSYISLNRNPRSHRTMLVSLLHGLEIQDSGLISFLFKDACTSIDSCEWKFSDEQQHIKKTIEHGFQIITNTNLSIEDSKDIYGEGNHNTNVENFENRLRDLYRQTFVEIVSETSFLESSFLITEKFLNSVYGCNFPILICSKGAVNLLRQVGFDMFDDIVDHSYDQLSNPIDRLYCAIYNNKDLLTDSEKTKELWKSNKHRFEANVDIAKNRMYEFYTHRAEKQFEKSLNELNIQN